MKLDNLPWTMVACAVPMLVGLFLGFTTIATFAGVAFGWSMRYELDKWRERNKNV